MVRGRVVAVLVSVLALVAGVLLATPATTASAAVSGPELVSFTPFRAADTRDGTGVRVGVVPARGVLEVPVAGRLGVPADAAAVVLNVAAVTPTAGGHLTVWPCGQARPTASTLNYPAGRTVANMALAVPGSGGRVCVYTHATTHLIMDVSGYWPKGSAFTGRVPVRAADTRDGTGVPAGIVPARSVLTVPVAGKYGVPADAAAVAVNVAAVTPTAGGHLTVWPCGAPRPTASNVNYVAGETTADAVVVKPGTGGAVCVYTHAATHLILDVVGHLAASSAFTAMVPVRVADTRYGTGVPTGQVAARATLVVSIAGRFGVPAGVGAVSVTVTAVTPTAGGHLTVYPCGDPRPTASNVNYVAGRTMAAAAIARLGEGGSLCVYTHAATHLIVDVNGHYAPTAIGFGATEVAAAASNVQCALMPGGYVKCWGYPFGPTAKTLPGIAGATAISGNCAIVAGEVKCWDAGMYPQVLVSTIADVAGATALARAGGQAGHNCAIVAGGAVKCWGYNSSGQLGDGTTEAQPTASGVQVVGLSGATAVAVGGGYVHADYWTPGHTCAVLGDGSVQCWGWNAGGQLGVSGGDRYTPVTVPGISGAMDAAAGFKDTCVVLSNGTIRCWGGDNLEPPAQVPGITTATSLAASGATDTVGNNLGHKCAVVDDRTVWCWGTNESGQLGDGTTTYRATPVRVLGVTGATAVSTAWYSSCAVVRGGDISCWGDTD